MSAAADRGARDGLVRPGERPLPRFWTLPLWDRPWLSLVRAVVVRSMRDRLTTSAASLVFYILLMMFPAAVAVVALLDTLGVAPGSFAAALHEIAGVEADAAQSAVAEGSRALGATTWAFVAGLSLAVYSLGRFVGGFMWAATTIRDAGPPDPYLRRLPQQLLVGVIVLVLAAVTAFVIVIGSDVAVFLSNKLGLGEFGRTAWSIAVWPLFIAAATGAIGVLYSAAPGSTRPHTHVSWGSLVGALSAALVSVGFSVWVRHFADYGRLYGALGSVVALLTWLWLINLALLAGLEVDAQRDRMRAAQRRS